MAEIKKISTELQLLDKFLDTSGDAGSANQVLVSTTTGINWVDGSGSGIIGGPYLPLSAGSGNKLTSDLYIDSTIRDTNAEIVIERSSNIIRLGSGSVSDIVTAYSGGQIALTLDASQNATFAGDINVLGEDINFATGGFADINNSGTGAIRLRPSGTTVALTLNATTSTFAGSVTAADLLTVNGDGHLFLGATAKTPKIDMMYVDSPNGIGWDTRIFIGRTDDLPNAQGFPTSTIAGGFGTQYQSNSDGAFFGIIPYATGHYRPVINWGDDVADSPFSFQFNGTNVVNISTAGNVGANSFSGDHRGTINTATTGATQTAGNNSTLIATTAYADAAAAAVPIGNYLPLSAGSGFPLTGDLYINSGKQLRLYRSDNATYARFDYSGSSVGLDIDDLNGDGINLQQAGVNKLRIETSGNATFAGDVTAPSFIGKLMGGATGAPDATIWCVSGDHTDWGIFYDENTPDVIQFKSGGTTTASISLDNGDYTGRNATFSGDVTIEKPNANLILKDTQGLPRIFKVGTINETFTIRNETAGSDVFTIQGLNNNAYFAGNVGIGTTSPTGLLTLQRPSSGANTDIDFLNEIGIGPKAKIRFGGTVEELAFYTGTNTLTERMRIEEGGNVGIGLTDPDSKLDVNAGVTNITAGPAVRISKGGSPIGLIRYDTVVIEANDVATIRIGESDGTVSSIMSGDNNLRINSTDPIKFYTAGTTTGEAHAGQGGTFAMIIDNSQNVGIGTTSPGNKLSVIGTGRVFNATSTNDEVVASITRSGGSLSTLGFNGTGSTSDFHVRIGANATSFVAYTSNTERMRIAANGNVGIGTTSPGVKLDVTDVIRGRNSIRVDAASTGSPYLGLYQNGGEKAYLQYQDSGDKLVLQSDGYFALKTGGDSDRITVLSGGNVGIGETSPATKLEVAGGILGGLPRLNTTQRHPMGHYTPGETIFEIDPTWDTGQLQSFFNSPSVAWTSDSTAPGGYAITITGQTGVGGVYGSGFPYIPVDNDGVYYVECYIKNVGTGQTHYMGGNEFNENFGSTGGNPGSYAYFVMSNTNPGNTWTKVTGYIGGFHASTTGKFELATKYWTPLGLFNWGAGTGTRACVISGWKIIRADSPGDRYFDGNVGIGTTSPSEKLEVDGNVQIGSTTDAKLYMVSTGGNGNNERFFIEGYADGGTYGGGFKLSTRNDSNIFNTAVTVNRNGNVGIGTTSPEGKMTVVGATQTINMDLDANSAIGLSVMGVSSGNFNAFTIGSANSQNNSGVVRFKYNGAGSTNNYMGLGFYANDDILNIKANGNVGIGTTSPTTKLQVTGSAYVNNGTLFLDTNQFLKWGNNHQGIKAVNDGNMSFVTGSNERVTINSSGNVGIGTTSPDELLHVDGTIKWEGVGTEGFLDGGETYVSIRSTASDIILDPGFSSNVGIGTNSPGSKLHVSGGDIELDDGYKVIFNDVSGTVTASEELVLNAGNTDSKIILDGADSAIKFITGNSTAIAINDSQSVGIGTTSPATTLDVLGTYRQINPGAGAAGGTVIARTLTYSTNPYGLVTRGYSNGLFTIQCERESNAGQVFNMALQPTGGNLGIGTTNPTAKLEVAGTTLIKSGNGTADLYLGNLGTSNYARFHLNNADTYFDMNCGNIIWRQGSSNRFEHQMTFGNFIASGSITSFGSPSDKTLKENIKPIESALDKVVKLQGVTFDWKKQDIANIKKDIGFIAQDVQKVLPELVREGEDGLLSMRHQGITPILLEAIKELKTEIETLKETVKQLTINN